jgi:hypothetical protein
MAASALTALGAGSAYASPEAGIDALIRPRFGVLLDPPLHRHHYDRPHDRYGYGSGGGYGYGYGYGKGGYGNGGYGNGGGGYSQGYPQGLSGWEQTETVDCGDPNAGPSPLNDALYRLADHGTLYIRGNSQACHESLYITRPVIIAGEPASAFLSRPAAGPASISPPDGQPCLTIQAGVAEVEIRDLTLLDRNGGSHACIEAWDSAVALVRTEIRYGGNGSAIYLSGGTLLARGLGVSSSSYDPAIVAEGVMVDIQGAMINAASAGIELTPTSGGTAKLEHVSIVADPGGSSGAAAEYGLIARPARGGPSSIEIEESRVSGFDTGLMFQQGSTARVSQVKITHARIAIVSEATRLDVSNSILGATRSGAYVIRGHARFTNNRIFGFSGLPIDVEPGAEVEPRPWIDNLIYPAAGCRHYEIFERWCRYSEDIPPPMLSDEGPGVRGWDGFPFEPPHGDRDDRRHRHDDDGGHHGWFGH